MKHINFVIGLVFVFSFGFISKLAAGNSAGDTPDWVLNSKPGCLVAQGVGPDQEQAKSNAEQSLKSMVFSKALQQMLAQNSYFRQIKMDSVEAGKRLMQSAFFSGFDKITHTTFFSQKVKNKETKAKEYHYFVQYKLEQSEIDKAINLLALDHESIATFKYVESNLAACRNVQELDTMKTKLLLLSPQFSERDNRKVTCNELLTSIEEKLDNIEIAPMLNIPGKLIVCLTEDNKAVISAKPPVVSCKTATINSIESVQEQWIIYYNSNDKANMHVVFDNAGHKQSKDFEIDPDRKRVEAKLTGASITVKNNRMMTFYVASSCRDDIIIDRLVLHYNDLHFTDTKLDQLLDGAGIYTINFSAPPDFGKIEVDEKVYGEMHYHLKATGQEEVYRFYNQKFERF